MVREILGPSFSTLEIHVSKMFDKEIENIGNRTRKMNYYKKISKKLTPLNKVNFCYFNFHVNDFYKM